MMKTFSVEDLYLIVEIMANIVGEDRDRKIVKNGRLKGLLGACQFQTSIMLF